MTRVPLTLLVIIMSLHTMQCGYILEGAVQGKWHDSGINYNKQVKLVL